MTRPHYLHRVRVLYIDTDAAQVVHHASYLRYFEAARIEMLRAVGWDYAKWMKESGLGLPVAENTVRYRSPAWFDEQLEIDTWVSRARRASLTFQYTVHRDGKLLTEGSTLCACTTFKGEVRRVPHELLKAVLGDEYDPATV